VERDAQLVLPYRGARLCQGFVVGRHGLVVLDEPAAVTAAQQNPQLGSLAAGESSDGSLGWPKHATR
jgi:hypothetical protein